MVSVLSQEENEFVISLGAGTWDEAWLGVSSCIFDTAAEFTSECTWADGNSVGYANWNTGEPSTVRLRLYEIYKW